MTVLSVGVRETADWLLCSSLIKLGGKRPSSCCMCALRVFACGGCVLSVRRESVGYLSFAGEACNQLGVRCRSDRLLAVSDCSARNSGDWPYNVRNSVSPTTTPTKGNKPQPKGTSPSLGHHNRSRIKAKITDQIRSRIRGHSSGYCTPLDLQWVGPTSNGLRSRTSHAGGRNPPMHLNLGFRTCHTLEPYTLLFCVQHTTHNSLVPGRQQRPWATHTSEPRDRLKAKPTYATQTSHQSTRLLVGTFETHHNKHCNPFAPFTEQTCNLGPAAMNELPTWP